MKLQEIQEYFEHAGVKGMKWGIRKDSSSGSGTKAQGSSGLSNAQLQTRINRMSLEKQYTELVAKENARNVSTLAKGLSVAAGILASSGKQVAQTLVTRKIMSLVDQVSGD